MALKLITAPAVEPVTLEQAKKQLNVTHDNDDELIDLLIGVARQHIDGPDGSLHRALITQTWELHLDRFPCNEIRIPLPPLQEISHVKYDDIDGVEQTLDPADYTVDTVNQPGWLLPKSQTLWPSTFDGINAVRIRFVAGYAPDTGDSPVDLRANVPKPIKQAILLMVRQLRGLSERNLFISSEDVPGVGSRSFVVSENAAMVMKVASESLLATYRVFD